MSTQVPPCVLSALRCVGICLLFTALTCAVAAQSTPPILSPTNPQEASKAEQIPPAASILPEAAVVERQLDAYVSYFADRRQFSGVVLVVRGGKPLFRKAYGYADWTKKVPNTPDTRFLLFSLSKSFTATAILLLQERGLLDVHDPIRKYLSDCPAEWKDVTIHHLLTHTSGIYPKDFHLWAEAHGLVFPDVKNPTQHFKAHSLGSVPGKKFRYLNFGYVLLAFVIEQASHQSYAAFLQQNIFAPLNLSNTGLDNDKVAVPGLANGHHLSGNAEPVESGQPTGFLVGAGNLYSTADDLQRWFQALREDRLLSAKWRERMFTPYIPTLEEDEKYGYGWFISKDWGKRTIQHSGSGSGFTSLLVRFPGDDLTIIALSNFDAFPSGMFGNEIMWIATGGEVTLTSNVHVPVGTLQTYTGNYYSAAEKSRFRIYLDKSNALHIRFQDRRDTTLLPISQTRFGFHNLQIEFLKDASGRVDGFVNRAFGKILREAKKVVPKR